VNLSNYDSSFDQYGIHRDTDEYWSDPKRGVVITQVLSLRVHDSRLKRYEKHKGRMHRGRRKKKGN